MIENDELYTSFPQKKLFQLCIFTQPYKRLNIDMLINIGIEQDRKV
jgi:hypothetical protein